MVYSVQDLSKSPKGSAFHEAARDLLPISRPANIEWKTPGLIPAEKKTQQAFCSLSLSLSLSVCGRLAEIRFSFFPRRFRFAITYGQLSQFSTRSSAASNWNVLSCLTQNWPGDRARQFHGHGLLNCMAISSGGENRISVFLVGGDRGITY